MACEYASPSPSHESPPWTIICLSKRYDVHSSTCILLCHHENHISYPPTPRVSKVAPICKKSIHPLQCLLSNIYMKNETKYQISKNLQAQNLGFVAHLREVENFCNRPKFSMLLFQIYCSTKNTSSYGYFFIHIQSKSKVMTRIFPCSYCHENAPYLALNQPSC